MSGPHDALFRATFSKPENAIAELRRVLPPALVARIDFVTLEMRPSRFVDPELEGRESDLLFAVTLDSTEALIYVLVEHQSTVDWTMPVRLLRYMASAWERYVNEHVGARKVPPIIPVVLHHSATGWTAATSLEELLDVPDSLRTAIAAHVPNFRFLLHDLAREDLSAIRGTALPPQLKLVLFLLQRARDNPAFAHELDPWVDVAQQLADDALRLVMSYIMTVAEIDPEPIADWARKVGSKAQEAYVTAAEKIAQRERAKALVEGRREGQLEGRREGQLEGRLDGRRETLQQLLEHRFGPLSASLTQRIQSASEEQLKTWASRVLDAQSIDQVFEI